MREHGFMDVTKLIHCGVYALLRKGEVVYVGKSKQPLMRIFRHVSNRGKRLKKKMFGGFSSPTYEGKGIMFDTVWFLPCMLGQMGTLEVRFIKLYMPKYNIVHNPEPKPRPEREPTVIMPIPEDIKELLRQMVVITSLPPLEDRPKVYMRRLL